MSDDIHTLLAKDAIRDVLYRYCRGLDRMDKPMAYSVFFEDATVDYFDTFQGTGRGFVDWVWEAHAGLERHSHQITNTLIEVDGDGAVSEAYVIVSLWPPADEQGQQREILVRGRYLDRWEKRRGQWAITHREHVMDMQAIYTLDESVFNSESTRGTDDPSFQLFGS